jgi:hypothetical protein
MSKRTTNTEVTTVTPAAVLAPLRQRLDAWAAERDASVAAAKARFDTRLLESLRRVRTPCSTCWRTRRQPAASPPGLRVGGFSLPPGTLSRGGAQPPLRRGSEI